MKKSQVSMEVVIILSALFIILLSIISFSMNNPYFYSYSKSSNQARAYVENLAIAINNLHLAGDGSKTTLILPKTLIDNTDYALTIYPSNHIIDIQWKTQGNLRHYSSSILTSELAGKTINLSGIVNLSNDKGVIIVTN